MINKILNNKAGNIIRALRIIWDSSSSWTIINGVVVLLKGIMPLLLIFVVQLLVDKVSGIISNKDLGNGINDVYGILYFAGGVFVLNAFLNSVSGIISEKHSFFITDAVQDMIHRRTTKIGFANFDDYRFQNVYYRAISESTYRPSRIYYGFIDLIQSAITLSLMMGVLLTLHWLMVIILVLVSVPVIVIRLKFSRKIYRFKKEHTEDERSVGYYNRLLTGKEFAKELRVFNLSSLFKKRFETKKEELRHWRFSLLKLKTRYEFLIQLLTASALIFVFGFIGKKAIVGEITQGQMVLYFLALYRGYNFLQNLLHKLSGLYEDGLFLKNLFEFIDYKVVKTINQSDQLFPEKLKQGIVINNLSFKYPNSSRHVFKGVNLKISAGETVALVGANGAGKSTLVKLICGLYHPDEGCVLFDDRDLTKIKSDSLADNVSVVFQDFMLYNVSAKENIWFGNIKNEADDQAIKNSAKKSGIHDLIEDFPKGYDTTLGTLFKESEMLSVGEWQRMALSRSFYNDAQVVILDEPTSSMDAFTESSLINNFKAIVKGRTAIIVSHRFSTIQLADKVVVLGEYGVIEEGRPDELITKKGAFYNMISSINKEFKRACD